MRCTVNRAGVRQGRQVQNAYCCASNASAVCIRIEIPGLHDDQPAAISANGNPPLPLFSAGRHAPGRRSSLPPQTYVNTSKNHAFSACLSSGMMRFLQLAYSSALLLENPQPVGGSVGKWPATSPHLLKQINIACPIRSMMNFEG